MALALQQRAGNAALARALSDRAGTRDGVTAASRPRLRHRAGPALQRMLEVESATYAAFVKEQYVKQEAINSGSERDVEPFTTVGFEHEFVGHKGPLQGISHLTVADSEPKLPFTQLAFLLETDAADMLELVTPPFLLQAKDKRTPLPKSDQVEKVTDLAHKALTDVVADGSKLPALLGALNGRVGVTFTQKPGLEVKSEHRSLRAATVAGGLLDDEAAGRITIDLQNAKHKEGIGTQVNIATNARLLEDLKPQESSGARSLVYGALESELVKGTAPPLDAGVLAFCEQHIVSILAGQLSAFMQGVLRAHQLRRARAPAVGTPQPRAPKASERPKLAFVFGALAAEITGELGAPGYKRFSEEFLKSTNVWNASTIAAALEKIAVAQEKASQFKSLGPEELAALRKAKKEQQEAKKKSKSGPQDEATMQESASSPVHLLPDVGAKVDVVLREEEKDEEKEKEDVPGRGEVAVKAKSKYADLADRIHYQYQLQVGTSESFTKAAELSSAVKDAHAVWPKAAWDAIIVGALMDAARREAPDDIDIHVSKSLQVLLNRVQGPIRSAVTKLDLAPVLKDLPWPAKPLAADVGTLMLQALARIETELKVHISGEGTPASKGAPEVGLYEHNPNVVGPRQDTYVDPGPVQAPAKHFPEFGNLLVVESRTSLKKFIEKLKSLES